MDSVPAYEHIAEVEPERNINRHVIMKDNNKRKIEVKTGKKQTLVNKNPLLRTSTERVFNPIVYIPD